METIRLAEVNPKDTRGIRRDLRLGELSSTDLKIQEIRWVVPARETIGA